MLFVCSMMAQHITLSGRVSDGQTTESIPFANVVLYSPVDTSFVRGTTADVEGQFSLNGIVAGRYLVRISSVGYQQWERVMEIAKSIDVNQIFLMPGALLTEVKVTAARPIFTMDGEKNIYQASDDPSIQSGTAIDALQNAPGIEIDAEGNIRLRGTEEVSIWINGRQSRMNAESLKQYLKTLPANSLKRIEVITNPSARYGGGRPVVNIVTQGKSSESQFVSLGLNGSAKPECSPWVSYIYNDEKWEVNLFANAAYAQENSTLGRTESLLAPTGDTSRKEQSYCTRKAQDLNTLFSADLAFRPDSLNTIWLCGAAYPAWSGWAARDTTTRQELLYQVGDHSFCQQSAKQFRDSPSLGFLDGVWYEHKFDDSTGHLFSVGYYGSIDQRDSLVSGLRQYRNGALRPINFKERNQQMEVFHGVEACYIRPFGRRNADNGLFANELEAGFDGGYQRIRKNIAADTFGCEGYQPCQWLSSQSLSRCMEANLFASLLHRWGSLTAKGGLRGSLLSGSHHYPDAVQHDFNHSSAAFIPSLHLSYTTARRHSFTVGYTRRVSMPKTSDLSTRKFYTLDGYSTGNPLLQTGYTHSLELKWEKYADGLGSVGINGFYHARTNHKEQLASVVLDREVLGTVITFTQPVNIGSSWNGGFDIHAIYRPNAMLNIRLNGSLFYDYIDLRLTESQESYSNGMWCFSLRINAWVKLWNKLQLFCNAYYSSPTQSLYITTLSRKGIDLGANADLLGKRLSINAGVNDLFDWNSWNTTSANPYLVADRQLKLTSRYVSFGLIFRFGKLSLEKETRKSRRMKEVSEEALN